MSFCWFCDDAAHMALIVHNDRQRKTDTTQEMLEDTNLIFSRYIRLLNDFHDD